MVHSVKMTVTLADQVNEAPSLTLSQMPLEVLELVLSWLTDPVSQRRLSQVSIAKCGVQSSCSDCDCLILRYADNGETLWQDYAGSGS